MLVSCIFLRNSEMVMLFYITQTWLYCVTQQGPLLCGKGSSKMTKTNISESMMMTTWARLSNTGNASLLQSGKGQAEDVFTNTMENFSINKQKHAIIRRQTIKKSKYQADWQVLFQKKHACRNTLEYLVKTINMVIMEYHSITITIPGYKSTWRWRMFHSFRRTWFSLLSRRGILGLHQSTSKVVADTNKETSLILFNAEKKLKLRWHGCGYLWDDVSFQTFFTNCIFATV